MPPVVASAGELTAIGSTTAGAIRFGPPSMSVELYNRLRFDYATIYRTQPNVRTVTNFFARNIAHIPFPLYERATDNDRIRLADHPSALRMATPNPLDRRLTAYRLMHATVRDIKVFDRAFWLFVGAAGGAPPAIVRLPADRVSVNGDSWLWPTSYTLYGTAGTRTYAPEQVAHFLGSIGVDDPLDGDPPIEALRRILAEEHAAGIWREQLWRSGARKSGHLSRPKDAPPWSTPARSRFKREWDAAFTGLGGEAGGTPILEEGMEYHDGGMTASDAQYLEARQLGRVEVAAVFHLDPIHVGVTETAGKASMEERRKALYMDTLAPDVVMLEQDLTRQVLPQYVATDADLADLYVEGNIAVKLRGSVTDQAESLGRLVGRPILTVNEARAMLNRNALPEGEGLTIPLNVLVGGQTIPGEAPPGAPERDTNARAFKAFGMTEASRTALRTEHRAAHALTIGRHFDRQRVKVLTELGVAGTTPTVDDIFDRDRWNGELADDLLALGFAGVQAFGTATADALSLDAPDDELVASWLPWLETNARIAAENINATTADQLATALLEDDVADAITAGVFGAAATARADVAATTRVTNLDGFASTNTAEAGGFSSKVWTVTSSNPRASHAAMDGEEVPIGGTFTLGGAWPGDAVMGADETAGCSCILEYT